MLGGSVPLAAVFEPIADLREGEAGLLGQGALLVGRRVAILAVAVLEGGAGLFLEAVDGLLTVPDGLGQRVLAAQTVLVHRPQRSVPHLLRFLSNQIESNLHIYSSTVSNATARRPPHSASTSTLTRYQLEIIKQLELFSYKCHR